MKILIGIVAVLVLIFIGPFLLLWSLNTLFPVLAIPYNLQTLVAGLLLLMLIVPSKVKK